MSLRSPKGGLKRRLLLLMLVPLAVLLVISTPLDYRNAVQPTMAAFDLALLNNALALSSEIKTDSDALSVDLQSQADKILRTDSEDLVAWAVYDAKGELVRGDPGLRLRPDAGRMREVYDDLIDHRPVRVARVTLSTTLGPAHALVAETLNKRERAQRNILTALLAPSLLLVILTLLIVIYAVNTALKPLTELRAEIEQRAPRDLRPIPAAHQPDEVQPLVNSLNRLFDQQRQADAAQQAFFANAAHQLRTPVAGLMAQIELAQMQPGAIGEIERGQRLTDSLDQLKHLIDQILTLARADPQLGSSHVMAVVAVEPLLEQLASSFLDRALTRNIDLGFDLAPCSPMGVEWLIRELAANLIDNALRYTPPGGQVTVSCGTLGGTPWIRVEDSGPGIPAADRERVFERFWRGASSRAVDADGTGGSGLGMAIVREIADMHGAQLELGHAHTLPAGLIGPGTRVTISFPTPPRSAG
ncbi:hypothetical protein IP84_03890 [beta proteobacterium AAP99]|nr:hypothetical protein IP84_03890 [beta proteobacterium AAP99]